VEHRQEQLCQWPDRRGEGHGADADGPTQQPADPEDGDLDSGPGQPDRAAGARGESGHQAVSRARAEARADVHARGHATEQDPDEQVRRPPHHELRAWQQLECDVDREADEDDVADRAQAGPLPKRDPQQQYCCADDDGHRADGQAQVLRETLMKHVPRVQAEPRTYQQPARESEQT
jgi:hypothetical protein